MGKKANKAVKKWRATNDSRSAGVASDRHVFRDFKNTAARGLSSVVTTFDHLSQKLKRSSSPASDDNRCDATYAKLSDRRTPIKLYSPFGFESPAPAVFGVRPSCRRQVFVSPSAKLKDDVLHVTEAINELTVISDGIRKRCSLTAN